MLLQGTAADIKIVLQTASHAVSSCFLPHSPSRWFHPEPVEVTRLRAPLGISDSSCSI
jgi:hypothetical protein